MKDGLSEVALPLDFPIGKSREHLGACEEQEFSPELTAALRGLAEENGTLVSCLSCLMLALFMLTLFQRSHQEDLCIELSCANRTRPETERMIGFFVNILPIRIRFSADMKFGELLRQVTASMTEAIEFQDYPFDLLIQKLRPPRRSNRPPLINVVYGFHDFQDLRLDLGFTPSVPSKSDITVGGWMEGNRTTAYAPTVAACFRDARS